MGPETLSGIFGKNLLADETLLPALKELCGESEVKPFECVGTREEVCIALCQSMKRYNTLPALLAYFSRTKLYTEYQTADFEKFLHHWDRRHFLPAEAERLLKRRLGIPAE